MSWALLALCVGNPLVAGEFLSQRRFSLSLPHYNCRLSVWEDQSNFSKETKGDIELGQIALCHHTVNSLAPSDAIWRHRTMSTLAQVMACCLTAPSHYLNQCWLIINWVLWHSLSYKMLKISILDMSLKITYLKLQPYLPGANELMLLL